MEVSSIHVIIKLQRNVVWRHTFNLNMKGWRGICDQCDYQASTRSSLNDHIIHEEIKYFCDQCNYKSKKKTKLLTHIKTKHEGIKYPCKQCDKQFHNQFNLGNNIKNIHEGIKYNTNVIIVNIKVHNISS